MHGAVPRWATFSPDTAGTLRAATASSTAAGLDCWLWGRPGLAPVAQAGDHEVLGRFGAVIGAGIA